MVRSLESGSQNWDPILVPLDIRRHNMIYNQNAQKILRTTRNHSAKRQVSEFGRASELLVESLHKASSAGLGCIEFHGLGLGLRV